MPHNGHTLIRFDCQVQTSEDVLSARGVPERDVFKLNTTVVYSLKALLLGVDLRLLLNYSEYQLGGFSGSG